MIRRSRLFLALLALLLPLTTLAQPATTTIFLPLVTRPLEVTLTASYLGGAGADQVTAAGFTPDGSLLLAGSFPGLTVPGVTPLQLLDGGAGALLRLAADGRAVTAITRIGGNVSDMEVSGQGEVVACGDFGVAVLAPDLASLRWSDAPGAVGRCAIGDGGAVAALVGTMVYRYTGAGERGSWPVLGTSAADVAIDDGRGLVFVTGYTQQSATLKVAYLRAYSLAGALAWTSYDHPASAITGAGLGADSEGRRVALGADGKLYLAGWTDGGNSIYGRDPRDVARRLGSGELIKFDAYNDPYNISGAKSLAWYGRFDPASGALELGQWLLTRLSDGGGNSISVRALDAAPDGTLLVVGDTAATIQGRAGMQLGGVTLGGYEAGEPYLLLVSPDFRRRLTWTALAAPNTSAGGSPASAAALSRTALAVGVTLNPRGSGTARGLILLGEPFQATIASPDLSEGYFVVLPRP